MRLEPGSLVAWVVLGLIAGWLAGQITRGHGFGCVGNVAIGLVGAIIGGFIFSVLGFHGPAGFFGSLVVAVIGAATLVALVNLIAD